MAAMGRGCSKTPENVVLKITGEVARIGQNATAKAIGVPLRSVQKYLKGEAEPTSATFQKLADYFGVSVVYLRGEDVVPKALLDDGAYIINKMLWPESASIYLKHLWLLTHEFQSVLDGSVRWGNDPLLIRPIYLKALNALEWKDDFYSNLDTSSEVYIKLKEYVESVFETIKSDFNISFPENQDIKSYFRIFARGVIDKYLAMLETIELDIIRGFSILYKDSFTSEEKKILKRRSQEEKVSNGGSGKKK
jgi:transcriptional regulator with XRE-family HTH domain